MPVHNFTFIVGPEEILADELVDQLYGFLDDALIGSRDREAFIEYDRSASTLDEAVSHARRELEENTALRALRVDRPSIPDFS